MKPDQIIIKLNLKQRIIIAEYKNIIIIAADYNAYFYYNSVNISHICAHLWLYKLELYRAYTPHAYCVIYS